MKPARGQIWILDNTDIFTLTGQIVSSTEGSSEQCVMGYYHLFKEIAQHPRRCMSILKEDVFYKNRWEYLGQACDFCLQSCNQKCFTK